MHNLVRTRFHARLRNPICNPVEGRAETAFGLSVDLCLWGYDGVDQLPYTFNVPLPCGAVQCHSILKSILITGSLC